MSIFIKQRHTKDCGPACLASVAAHYKLKVPVAFVQQLAGTDHKGTNLLGLITAANKLGLDAKAIHVKPESLTQIPLPAIVHVVIGESQHYVVLYKANRKHVEIMDPALGTMLKQSIAKFTDVWSGILVMLFPNDNFKKGNHKVSRSFRFWQLLNPYQGIIIQTLFGAFIYTILGFSTAIFAQKITDHVLIDGNTALLHFMGVLMVIILWLRLFIGTVKSLFILRTGQKIDAHLILGYYKHLLKLPQQFFDTMRVGEMISRINDAVKIRTFISDVAIGFAVNLFIVFFSFLLMFTYYWKLALCILLVIPLYMLVYWLTHQLNKRVIRKLMEQTAELESQLVESLSAIATIKRFGLEEHTHIKTERRLIPLLRTIYRASLNSIFSGTSVEMISQLLTIVLLWAGAGYVLTHQITPGELFSLYTLVAYFIGPTAVLIGTNNTIQEAMIASDRLFEIMDLDRENDREKAVINLATIGDIHFKQVTFSYGTRGAIFEDLNLNITSGSFTAIVGESGSGKSTLAALLQNIYPIQKGHIFFGKHAIKYLDHTKIRNLIGVVPQKIDLFAGHIMDNIAVGDDDPDLDRIIDICTQLGIISFIEGLPDGFQTQLGEHGAMLSGGQKQRIAIARALYRDPEVLILDEATSSLDSTAEQHVLQTIELLLDQQKTIIIITHRLSTIYNADKIIVLAQGKVVEEGRHAKMILANGPYYKLWQQQFGGKY